VDISEAAVKARSENLSEHVSTLALTNDAELPANQRLDKFYKFVDVSEVDGWSHSLLNGLFSTGHKVWWYSQHRSQR
jgi:hypothetical protein